MPEPPHPTTIIVHLPGERSRLRQLILYVSTRCMGARHFGLIKLNKIIWKADFDSFAAREVPVTGREYRRQKFGPVPREMKPLHDDMLRQGAIRIERRVYADDIVELRTVPQDIPDLSLFTDDDMSYVDASISHYWRMTGTESSDESHGVAWRTRRDGDPMPYESAILSNRELSPSQRRRVVDLIQHRQLTTL
jgi:hypothetical protein